MKPVMQRQFVNLATGQQGDCLRAVVASLLELDLDNVPHFVQEDVDGGPNWWQHLTMWLDQRGYKIYFLDPEIPHLAPRPGEHYYAVGPSPRGVIADGVYTTWHAVVYRDEQLAHDPHPDGTGIVKVANRYAFRATAAAAGGGQDETQAGGAES